MLFIAFVCILLKTHIDIRSKYVKTRKPAESVAYSAFYITFRKPVNPYVTGSSPVARAKEFRRKPRRFAAFFFT